jgi:hypothetical protein
MRTRWVFQLAFLVLSLAAAAARAGEAPEKPAVVVRAASVDRLMAELRFLAEAAGRGDEAGNLEGLIKAMTDGNGLQGVDPTRPLGLYAYVGPQGLDSTATALVPIADEKTFLALVEKLTGKEPASSDGIYEVQLSKIPFPIYFRFAHKYLYATGLSKDALAKGKLLDPTEVLAAARDGVLSATVRIDRIPAELRNIALGQIELNLARIKEQSPPGETPAQAAFRTAAVDELSARIKSLLRDGGAIDLHMQVDRKARELALSLSLAAQPGSPLAQTIAELGKARAVGASLVGASSALSIALDVGLSARLRATLGPVLDEAEKKAVEEARAQGKGDIAATLIGAIKPTFQGAELDAGLDIRGPGPGGKFTVLAGMRIKDGEGIDKALHKLVAALPDQDRRQIQIDFDKIDQVPIHRITPAKVDREFAEMLGKEPVYLAVRADALLVAAGEEGLEALKQAIGTAPRKGTVFQVEMSAARMAPLLEKEHQGATAIAKKAFANDKEGDRVVIRLSGGDSLKLRVSMKTPLLQFFSLLDEAKKSGP